MVNCKESDCATQEKYLLKRRVFSLPLKTATETVSVKRSSHKSFHNVAGAYEMIGHLGPNFFNNKHALIPELSSWLCYQFKNIGYRMIIKRFISVKQIYWKSMRIIKHRCYKPQYQASYIVCTVNR